MNVEIANLISSCSNPAKGVLKTSTCSFSHTWGNKKEFFIPMTNLTKFYLGYCNAALKDVKKEKSILCEAENLGMNISEIVSDNFLPLIVFFNFRFPHTDDAEYYTDEFVKKITATLQNIISKYINVSTKQTEFLCCVLESQPSLNSEGEYVENLRFHFPYCRVTIDFLENVVLKELKKLFSLNKLMDHLSAHPLNDIDDILNFDYSSIPMYRSKTGVNLYPHQLTHIYDFINLNEDEDDSSGSVKEIELNVAFNPAVHSFIKNNLIDNSILENSVESLIPFFLSIHYYGKLASMKTEIEDDIDIHYVNIDKYENDLDPKYLINTHLQMLSPNRFIKEGYWLTVGKAIYNVYNGSKEGLDLWVKYSEKTHLDTRTRKKCQSKYFSFREVYYTEKTIAWFARIDNYSAYLEWHNEWCNESLNNALSLIQDDVANAIWRLFWLEYVCDDEGKQWYYYSNNTYTETKGGMQLKKDISTKFKHVYVTMLHDTSKKMLENKKGKGKSEDEIECLNNLIKKIGTDSFKRGVLNFCKEKFHNPAFFKYVNKNPNLIGCFNGVIETCDTEAFFREGKPEDYITKNTGIIYNQDFTWDSDLVQDLMEWIRKVFCHLDEKTGNRNDELVDFFLKYSSSHLKGRNSEKYFAFWLGETTNNSKSMIQKLFQATLGEYVVDLPLGLIKKVKEFGSSGPSPEYAQIEGSHTGFFCEPDEDDDLDAGKIKKIAGGDRFFARKMRENGGSIENFIKAILVSNNIPNIPGIDEATFERFCIIPFLSEWKDVAPFDPREQLKQRIYKKDPFFENCIPELAPAFLWVLVQYYKQYREQGLVRPKCVREYAQRYFNDNNPYIMFIREKLEYVYLDNSKKEIDLTIGVSAIDMYPAFKRWHNDSFPGREVPKKPKFKKEMMKPNMLGPNVDDNKRWLGIRVKKKDYVPNLNRE